MEAGKSPDWLPAGWTEEVKVKGDRKYKCYIDPLTGRKFYSKPQVSDYLRTVQRNSSALQQEKTGTISVSQHNTSELTGDETYLKEEEPQDVKALKRTSCKSKLSQTGSSMQPVEEVFQPLASDVSGKVAGMSPDWLPAGWTEHVKDNNGRKVKCYIDPLSGRKFYSKPQVSDYLRTVQHNSSALQQEKMGTVSVSQSNMVELSGDKTTLKAKGSKFRTRSCSKQIEMGFSNESVEHNTSELTGGETNLKEEEPQNVKALKRTSCKSKLSQTCSSMQPVEEVFQPLASDVSVKVAGMSPDWLPAGWTEHVKDNNGRKVKCYVDPLTGRKFYSKPQVSEYLRTVKQNSSASQQNKNADVCELTGGKTTLKPTGPQFRTRSSKQIDMGFSNESAEKLKMDELNGGKTSLKEEKSHNDKTLKQTSCKSERKQTAKVVIESVTPDGLPPGWRKEIKIQKKANGTRKDTYYTDPVSGYVFFSQADALRYLKTGDVKSCSMKPKKRDELGFLDVGTLAKMGELGVATNSQRLEGSQNAKITKRKSSHTSNRKPVGSAEQPVEKGVIESVATEGLPPGWLQETYYTDPASGYVFFSLEDALCYLETGDFDKCTVKPKKRDKLGFFNEDTSPNVSELTRVKNSLKKEGSQNGVTPKATRRVTKQREMGFSEASIEKSNMVEITGGRTSLKQEGSQNVKTPKSTSRLSKQKINGHSKHSVENEMIERVTPDGLPPEWIKEVRIQKKANGTRKDTYYTDPVSGYVFLSQKDALRYLKSGDIRMCAMRPKKRDELGFLNEASSLPSGAATQKIGDHTPKRRLFAGERLSSDTHSCTENSDTRSLETADAGGPRKRQRILKGKLSPGTQNSVSRSLETADAGGPQKRQCTRKDKLSPGDAIEEGADKKESYDPTSSPPPITKGSKRKQGKRVDTGNSTVSKKKDKSTNSEATNKSNRKLETGASRSKRKKAVGVPSRSSSRLMGPQSKMVKSLETEPEPSVGPIGDVAHSGHHQFPTVAEKEIADSALGGTEAPSNGELSNTSKNPLDDQAVALEDQSVAEDQPLSGETVITDVENQDQENPFAESWSDPCLEFAFKTLSGEMPVKDNLHTQGNFQEHSENPNPQAGGCLALLDFGVPNSYQNNNNVVSGFDAQEDPVSDSGPISPKFLASGNVSSLFVDPPGKPVSDAIPPGFSARSPTFDAPSKPVSDFIPPGFSACSPISLGFSARSPTFDAPSNPVSDSIPPGFSARSPIFDAPSKHVADAVPRFPDSPLFLASGNAGSPIFGAPSKHVADSVPQFPNSPLFLASRNVNSPSFHAPAKPESDSMPQLPTTHAFLAFGNVSSPNYSADAPQQSNWDDKEHRPNLNL
ncbi:hypothetical protein RHGRI_021444 [Rhododendron griersonianum]|uniref:MBD domain-containing protein n=1 Tax=Rhododendron griersonianum TaxID=479676 RepID=A0AAV6JPQ7_9ERIC|nr:hypothetical protein RHGRI_021444 [Rhododendron griersonianum]